MKFKAITYEKYRQLKGYKKGCGYVLVPAKYMADANWNLRLVHNVLIEAGFSCLNKKEFEFEIAGNSSEVNEKIFEVLAYEIKHGLVDLKYA